MGQSSSTPGSSPGSTHRLSHPTPTTHHCTATVRPETLCPTNESSSEDLRSDADYISELPDECLAWVFQSLSSGDRKACSLVCRRWLMVEGQSRHRMSLNAQSELLPLIPSLFSRFDSVTKLALRCDRRSVSINDDALTQISIRCPNLTRLKLRSCRELTDLGMASLAKNCKGLKKFSCGSCNFGVKGMNALLNHCSSLEEISVKRLRGGRGGGGDGGGAAETIGPGLAGSSLKTICLKELYNGQCFGPLIVGAKNLRTLKILRCLGDWDRVLEMIGNRKNSVVEIHLERLEVSDDGLMAISNCLDLEILHLVKTPECTNFGIVSVAKQCKLLRKLHIDGWRTNRIGDEGLIAIAKHSANLQELVLIGVNPSSVSLEAIATNCQKLERLALCGSETIGDTEISCVAVKCVALKKLCIKACPVSDEGIEGFAWGCPNLVKIKVKKCRGVTSDLADWLRVRRGSLVVNLDANEVETDGLDASTSDGGAQEDGVEFPSIVSQVTAAVDAPSSSNGRPSMATKSRFGGTAQDAVRIRRLEKQREAERRKIQELKNKTASTKGQPGLLQFGSGTSEILETAFKKETVGLVTREQYVEKRVNIRTKIEEEEKEKLLKLQQEEEELQAQKRQKRKIRGNPRLSFSEDIENGSEEDVENSEANKEPKRLACGKLGKDPTVETSFLPDSEREAEEQAERERLQKQWQREQEQIRNEPLEITYSYWDGAGHRRVLQVRKGDTIGEFLRAVQQQLAPEFREIRTTSVENLLYVKEDLIIPHQHSFYELIVNKARGKSGPLFHFDVHEDVRTIADATIEKDESHAGKVVERHWYEKNKHIFPASRWEIYDPTKKWERYTIHGD